MTFEKQIALIADFICILLGGTFETKGTQLDAPWQTVPPTTPAWTVIDGLEFPGVYRARLFQGSYERHSKVM